MLLNGIQLFYLMSKNVLRSLDKLDKLDVAELYEMEDKLKSSLSKIIFDIPFYFIVFSNKTIFFMIIKYFLDPKKIAPFFPLFPHYHHHHTLNLFV